MGSIPRAVTQPIQTSYKGYRFRSRLEARWAVFFDALALTWDYEPEAYRVTDGGYLIDFYLPQVQMFAEVKPNDNALEVVIPAEAKRKARDLALQTVRPVIFCDGVPRNTNYWALWPDPIEADMVTWEDVHFCDENRYHVTEGRLYSGTGAGLFRHYPTEAEPWSPWYDEHPAVIAARSARFGEQGRRP